MFGRPKVWGVCLAMLLGVGLWLSVRDSIDLDSYKTSLTFLTEMRRDVESPPPPKKTKIISIQSAFKTAQKIAFTPTKKNDLSTPQHTDPPFSPTETESPLNGDISSGTPPIIPDPSTCDASTAVAAEESFGFFKDTPKFEWDLTKALAWRTASDSKKVRGTFDQWMMSNHHPRFAYCGYKNRIGSIRDGWWVCDPHRLEVGCSVGIQSLADHTVCDFSPDKDKLAVMTVGLSESADFLRTLAENQDFEFRPQQLLIAVIWDDKAIAVVQKAFDELYRLGYVMFHKENVFKIATSSPELAQVDTYNARNPVWPLALSRRHARFSFIRLKPESLSTPPGTPLELSACVSEPVLTRSAADVQRASQTHQQLMAMRALAPPKNNAEKWYTDHWFPTAFCRFERRIGTHNDGGKWVCDPHRLISGKKDCLIYSIGYGGNWSFEDEMFLEVNNHCEIHVFEIEAKLYEFAAANGPKHVHFHHLGFSAADGASGMTLKTMMKRLGHTGRRLDIFKIDCEGCEFPTYRQFFDRSIDVRQVLIEIHWGSRKYKDSQELLEFAAKNGFAVTHKEPNYLAHSTYTEFALVIKDDVLQ